MPDLISMMALCLEHDGGPEIGPSGLTLGFDSRVFYSCRCWGWNFRLRLGAGRSDQGMLPKPKLGHNFGHKIARSRGYPFFQRCW
jgi:hypothetical protein